MRLVNKHHTQKPAVGMINITGLQCKTCFVLYLRLRPKPIRSSYVIFLFLQERKLKYMLNVLFHRYSKKHMYSLHGHALFSTAVVATDY